MERPRAARTTCRPAFIPEQRSAAEGREPDPEDTGGIGYVGAVDNTFGNGVVTLGHKRRQHVGSDCVQLVLIIGRPGAHRLLAVPFIKARAALPAKIAGLDHHGEAGGALR